MIYGGDGDIWKSLIVRRHGLAPLEGRVAVVKIPPFHEYLLGNVGGSDDLNVNRMKAVERR